jgi:hypothetical protein
MNAKPWDAAISQRVQEILDALEAPPIDKVTRDTFCRWLHRRRKFADVFRNEPLEVEEHIILTCRAILESKGNDNALIEPIVTAVSLCMRPQWVSRGVGWIAAFDDIPLVVTLQTLVGLFGQREAARHFPSVLKRKLWQAFGPDVVVGAKPAKRAPKPPASVTRVAGIERKIELGLKLIELRSTVKWNNAFSALRNKHYPDLDPMDAADAMRVARLYGSRPEIVSRLSWAALVTLSSPTLAGAIRDALERRIAAGDKIDTPAIRAARGARQAGRTRRQAARPAVRMAA